MNRDEPIVMSLTAESSHSVKIDAGQGSFSIGASDMNPKQFDVLVDNELPINWDCFNSFYTPAGEEEAHLNPNGNWPRFFYYWGNDSGFIQWSEKRKIEDFTWSPLKPVSVDFTKSNINSLSINSETHKIQLKLGNHSRVSFSGNIENFKVSKVGTIASLYLYPQTQKDSVSAYELPTLKVFKDVTTLYITVPPVGQPFDCNSLLPFKKLTYLALSGNLTNLEALAQLEDLETLHIRYAPNLENFPALKTWPHLKTFIGWNIEDVKGKLLRAELKKIAKEKELEYSSVSQLRKHIWFTTEYGIPFTAWSGKNEKAAIRAYKAAVKKLNKVKTETEAEVIITEFVAIFNELPGIETTEREDVGEAVFQLRQVPAIEIDADLAIKWFDAVRDF